MSNVSFFPRLFIEIGCTILMFCAPALAADSAGDAPANSWVEIPNTKMSTVVPREGEFPETWGVCGPTSVISEWSGAALDTKRSRLILFGGGHADYAGNELYAFDVNKLAWERMTDPFPNPKDDDSDENEDGTPQSRHSYGGLAYLGHRDRFFALGGSVYRSGHGACDRVWTFDLAGKKWSRSPRKTPFRPGYDCTCAFNPATGKLWFCNMDSGSWASVWSYDFDHDAWTRLNIGEEPGYRGAALDTKRGRLVVLSAGKVIAHDVRGSAPAETWVTTGDDEFLKQHEVGFDYDPVADKLVGWGAAEVFVLDPQRKAWAINNPPGAPKPSGNGTFGRWRYVPSVNAFILVTGIDVNVHFFKLTEGTGHPK